MRWSNIKTCTVGFLLAGVLSACATTTPPSTAPGAAARQVPALKIAADCGSCQVRPNVPALIRDGYAEAASKAGVQIQDASSADVTIVGYADRNDAARFLVGVFAGKDEIRATVRYAGAVFTVEDYYRNAWLGIEHLAKKIGGMIFEKIKK